MMQRMEKANEQKPKLSSFFIVFGFFYFAAYYWWIVFFRGDLHIKTIVSDSFSAIGSGAVMLALCYAVQKSEGSKRFFWIFLAAAQTMYFLSELIWVAYFEIYLKKVPFPSICDILYMSQLFFILAGILYLAYLNGQIADSLRLLLNILILMTAACIISLNFLINPSLEKNELDIFSEIISVGYPIFDLGLLFGVLSLNSVAGMFDFKVLALLAAGLAVFGMTDAAYLYLQLAGGYYSGSPIDPGWIAGIMLIAFSALIETETKGHERKNTGRTGKRLSLGIKYTEAILTHVSLISLLVLIALTKNADIMMIGIVLIIILLLLKQNLSFFENQKLLTLLMKANHELEVSRAVLEEKNEKLNSLSIKMEQEARTDYLTGLYNRRYADCMLEALIGQAYEEHRNLSILIIDVDHFKKINDEFGHKAGDLALQEVAKVIRENVRNNAVIARFGGEEFIGILPDAKLQQAIIIAERIRKNIESHETVFRNFSIKVTVSIGVAELQKEFAEDMQSLFKRADNSMYSAKNRGRNCVAAL